MISKALPDISLDDLKQMLGTARESKTLEFKRMMPAKTDKEAVQLLSAVTAFANTAGGDLVIGIDTEDGIATHIVGIPLTGYDAYKLHIEQLLASNIEPRLPPVLFHSIECGNKTHVVIIRIPQSWQAPHRVNKDNKFYGRHSSGKYPLDVSELRTAFALRRVCRGAYPTVSPSSAVEDYEWRDAEPLGTECQFDIARYPSSVIRRSAAH